MKTIKKSFLLITLIAIFVCMFSVISNAETYGDLTYTVSDGEVTITKCSTSATSVNIPSTIDGCPVTRIGKSAFSGCTGLTIVTIPDSVKSIGYYAFKNCESLASITIPDSVTTIEGYTFQYCYSLTSITIPDSVSTMGSYSFASCTDLTSVTIGEGVTRIGSSVFFSCDKLAQVNWNARNVTDCSGAIWDRAGQASNEINVLFGDNVEKIPQNAFEDCNYLKSVTIPDNVTEIGSSAFEDCESLETVIVGDGVTIIGAYAFRGCPSLTSVTIGDSVTEIGAYAFSGCTTLKDITIPDSVTSIGDYSFLNCRSLTSITIPEGVTSIGLNAFNTCTGLTQINWNAKNVTDSSSFGVIGYAGQANCGINLVFGDNVERIPSHVFADCANLKCVTIPDNVTSIGAYTFEDCVGLETVTIGDGVTIIEGYSFRGCTSLKNVTIGDSVTEIGTFAFRDCISLTDITIPDTVKSIGSFAFANCRSLTSITIPEGVTSIDTYAFDSCVGLTQIFWNAKSVDDIASNGILNDAGQLENGINVVLGDNVERIPSYAFAYCESIKSVTIPDSVTSIGHAAFYHCDGLTSITIPDSVTKIGNSAFAVCLGLKSVIIGDGITIIEDDVFYNCRSLTSVTIPCSVTIIDQEAFQGCKGLKEVHISDIASWCGIDFFDQYSNPLYYAEKLYVNGELLTNLIIPDTIIHIGDYSFCNCTGLTSVKIPDSVTSIGDSAFEFCTGLKEVHISDIASWCGIVFGNIYSNPLYYAGNLYVNNELVTNLIIPGSVTNIGEMAFASCAGLTSVTIGDGVTSIGYSAFYKCTGLTSVTMPDSVTSIDDYAFSYCTELEEVHISDIASWCGMDFYYYDSNPLYYAGKLYVNDELITNLIVPDGVTSIGSYAFTSCTGLTSVTIPDSVTSIDSNAFYEIDDLVFYGTSGNVAEQYADSNGYEFIPLRSLVVYDANGGENAPESHVKLYNKSIKLSTAKPIRIGHRFLGWSTDKYATVPEYKPGATYKEEKNLTLYAVWEEVIIPVKKVVIDNTKLSLIVWDTATLTATVSPVDANFQYVTWSSSNESVATVDENGVVTALKAGSVKITATSHNGKKATCTVTVGEPATKVEFTGLKSTSLAFGKSLTLKAKASRDDKVKPVSTNVIYEIIEGEEYATIDAKGKLKGIATGEVVVRATAEAGTEDAHAEVVINVCIPATKVKLNMTKASMIVGGEDLYLSAEISPENNTDTLTWSVDKPEIAEVDENGVVTALKAGKVKVTAVSGSGKKATCSITVGEPATKVEFSSLKSTSLAVGKTLTLKAKASRDDKVKPVSTAVVFEIVEGEEFATIDAKGKLKGIATGEVVVRATAEAGTEDAHAEVVINVCIPATKVKLNMTKATVSLSDGELQLEANITPLENTDTLTWMSANEDIASVDDNGLVTVRSKGKVKITAMTGSGKKATCTVTVTE